MCSRRVLPQPPEAGEEEREGRGLVVCPRNFRAPGAFSAPSHPLPESHWSARCISGEGYANEELPNRQGFLGARKGASCAKEVLIFGKGPLCGVFLCGRLVAKRGRSGD